MKWISIDLSRVSEIEKQTEEVVRTFDTLAKQLQRIKSGASGATTNGTTVQVSKAVDVLKTSIANRIDELGRYYREHDLDPRASRLETCRLKLKKTMRENDVDIDKMTAPPSSSGAPSSARGAAAGSGGYAAAASRQQVGPSAAGAGNSGAQAVGASSFAAGGDGGSGTPGGGSLAAPAAAGILGGGIDEVITLKIHLTHAEFEDLKNRREAYKRLKQGGGHLAWEAAYQSPRVDPAKEGMFTYHDIPFKQTPTRQLGPEPRTVRLGPTSSPRQSFLSSSEPYRPQPSSAALSPRQQNTPRGASSGPAFVTATRRSAAGSALSKIAPLGSAR